MAAAPRAPTFSEAIDEMVLHDFSKQGACMDRLVPHYNRGTTIPEAFYANARRLLDESWQLLVCFVDSAALARAHDSPVSLDLTWPRGCDVHVNGRRIVPRKRNMPTPITEAFLASSGRTTIKLVSREHDLGAPSDTTALLFFTGYDAKAASGDMAHLTEAKAEAARTFRETYLIDEEVAEVEDCAIQEQRILLLCPITLTRVKNPVKARSCKHRQCFDYDTFVTMMKQSRNPDWKCPLCNASAGMGFLVRDVFVRDILESPDLPDNAEAVHADLDNSRWWVDPKDIDDGDDDDFTDDDDVGVPVPSRKVVYHDEVL